MLVRRTTACRRTGGAAQRNAVWLTARSPLPAARLTGSGVPATFAAGVSRAVQPPLRGKRYGRRLRRRHRLLLLLLPCNEDEHLLLLAGAVTAPLLPCCTPTAPLVAKSGSHRATVTCPLSAAPATSCHRGSLARQLHGHASTRMLIRRSAAYRRTGGAGKRTGSWRTAKTPLPAARLTLSGVSATFAAGVSRAVHAGGRTRTVSSSSSSPTAAPAAAVQPGRTLPATCACGNRPLLNCCTPTARPVAKSGSHRATLTCPLSAAPATSCHRGSLAR
ncbi:hypothetical protein TTRE_0000863401 [Trichuris trichiura]|uniref:Uncharacterized protein n=1 Tax=Trichuris trichiura TaxID=36087 RepID=A0A077ZNL2_TRITR|nr:hypothetical protein TTRE_0000863401 [Trichuris trichiura]